MTEQIAHALAQAVRTQLQEALARVLDLSRVTYRVEAVESSTMMSAGGKGGRVITAVVATNDRDAFIGRTQDLAEMCRDGHNSGFVEGFLTGRLISLGLIDSAQHVEVRLDVYENAGMQDAFGSLGAYAHRSREQLLHDGYLSAESPLYSLVMKYELEWFLTSGNVLCGPSFGLMVETERAVAALRSSSVLDVFAGTGGISRVALQSGARSATAVDVRLPKKLLAENLGPFRNLCETRETDVRDFQLAEQVDLVVCDPFYETSHQQMLDLVPALVGRCETVIVNLGPVTHPRWCRAVADIVAKHFSGCRVQTYGTELVGVFTTAGGR